MLVSGNCCSLNMFLLMSLSFLKGKLKRMRVGSYNFLLQKYPKPTHMFSHVMIRKCILPAMFWDVSTIHTSTFGKATSPTVEPHLSSTKMPHLSSQPFFGKEPTISLHQKTWCWMLKPANFGKLKPQKIYKTWPNWIPYDIWCTNPWRAGTVDWEFPLASFPPLRCQRCYGGGWIIRASGWWLV